MLDISCVMSSNKGTFVIRASIQLIADLGTTIFPNCMKIKIIIEKVFGTGFKRLMFV